MDLNVVPIISITVICYLIGMFWKSVDKLPDKFIPVVVGVIGGILSLIAFYTIPGWEADSWLTALEIGIASGLASTGINQVYKQLTKE